MKILIATGLYPPEMGGPATYSVFLEKHLPRFGIEYVVVPFSHVRTYPRILRHVLYMFHLIRRARTVDVLYALDTVSVGLPVYIVSLITRKPYLVRVPGDYAWEQGQQRYGVTEDLDTFRSHPVRSLPVHILSWIQYQVALHARHIIVPSMYMKGIVAGWGIPSSNITCVYSALKTLEVSKDRSTLRHELGYDGCVVVSAGRLVPWKGFSLLIEVIGTLRREGIPISLHILGDGVCREELESLVRTHKLESTVHFHGTVDRDCMAEHIVAADVFVLNTSYEGLSHQLIEVMSLETPIITTGVGGNPELITDNVTGLLIPYNHMHKLEAALRMVLRNPAEAHIRAREAKKRIALFHEDVASQAFVDVIKTLWK